jgi:hypothetical protein
MTLGMRFALVFFLFSFSYTLLRAWLIDPFFYSLGLYSAIDSTRRFRIVFDERKEERFRAISAMNRRLT